MPPESLVMRFVPPRWSFKTYLMTTVLVALVLVEAALNAAITESNASDVVKVHEVEVVTVLLTMRYAELPIDVKLQKSC